MKPIKIKKSSWAYQIAKYGGLYEWWEPSICEFNKHFLIGLFYGFFSLVFLFLLLYIMATPLYYGILHLIDPANVFPVTGSPEEIRFMFGIVFDIMLIGIFVVCYYLQYRYDHPKYEKIKEPSKLTLHWRAFKDKICVKVEYED